MLVEEILNTLVALQNKRRASHFAELRFTNSEKQHRLSDEKSHSHLSRYS